MENQKEDQNLPNQANANPEQEQLGKEVVQDAMSQIREASELAKQAPKNDGGMVLKDDANVASSMQGLPMRELIGAPLFAVAEAQQKLALTAWEFYSKIAFEQDEKGEKPTSNARIIKFDINRPIEVDGVMTSVKQTVEAPFIGLVPIPSLLIDKIDVDFQMEVTSTNTEKSKTEAGSEVSVSGGWFGVKASVSGKVSTSKENTRSSNQTAKYQVKVTASQQPQTEGLSKLMDIMASCIEPVPKKENPS